MAHDVNLDDGQRQALMVFEQYSATRSDWLSQIQKVREQIAAEYKHPTVDTAVATRSGVDVAGDLGR